jgi:hypothetical protein
MVPCATKQLRQLFQPQRTTVNNKLLRPKLVRLALFLSFQDLSG